MLKALECTGAISAAIHVGVSRAIALPFSLDHDAGARSAGRSFPALLPSLPRPLLFVEGLFVATSPGTRKATGNSAKWTI